MNDMRTMTDTYHIAQFTHQCIHITLTDSSTPLTAIHIPATSDAEEDKRSRYSVTLTTLKRFMHQTNTILTVVFCGLGGLFAIIAIVLIIVLIHIKKKQKSGKNFAENELYEENNYPYE